MMHLESLPSIDGSILRGPLRKYPSIYCNSCVYTSFVAGSSPFDLLKRRALGCALLYNASLDGTENAELSRLVDKDLFEIHALEVMLFRLGISMALSNYGHRPKGYFQHLFMVWLSI